MVRSGIICCIALLLVALTGCERQPDLAAKATPDNAATVAHFGSMPDGREVKLITLRNRNGMEVAVTNYGAIVQRIVVPDRDGEFADVTLGFDTLDDHLGEHPYFGAVVGRYANRIAGGKFSIGGTEYTLATNNGPNSLHGGIKGFDKVLWDVLSEDITNSVTLRYVSADGEEGYPGTLTATVVYTLTDENELRIDYSAESDKPTPVNLSNHTYFNLAGNGDVLEHEVMIAADRFTPVDSTLIPLGTLRPVDGTPFDFRRPTAIGERIGQGDTQLEYGMGYDHNWVLNREPGGEGLFMAARVHEPQSGRVMEVLTTEPGLQFYTGNFLDGSVVGKGGKAYEHRSGFCMETQHYPDSPNQPDFPSTILAPGEVYESTTIYRFSTDEQA
jgi:aldose 1-epimerase